ncbi:MAG: hypothetical protein N2512_09445 [Armatimonadetes bacterium]|nr:hypothetical protein [Armatimonadota bacterium]
MDRWTQVRHLSRLSILIKCLGAPTAAGETPAAAEDNPQALAGASAA